MDMCAKTGGCRIGVTGFFLMTTTAFVAAVFQISMSARTRGRHYGTKGCEFPSQWTGTWFQKGVHPLITIDKDVFSFKGKCHDSDGHMFFIEESKDNCFRCVVLYEKHRNVLQYRETFCDSYASLHQACNSLSADATLYSLFRVNAEPVPCQLHGPYTFSYSRGGRAECRYPVSTVESCMDDSRLLFRFQACADVMGTESSVEELSCLALWKEGSAHYLVGKMKNKKQHNPAFADDNAYRCFVFEFLPEKGEIQMSQNSDATCDGLVSPWEGSRTMKLVKKKHPSSSCRFPSWVINHRWQTLDGQKSFVFDSKSSSFKVVSLRQDQANTKYICIAEVGETANSTTYITHGMSGCESGFACVKFFKRHSHIMELQMGSFARSPQEACHSAFSDHIVDDLITLVASSLDTQICPSFSETNGLTVEIGKFSSSHNVICGEPTLTTTVGCQAHDTMRFLITCSSYTDIQSFHCHGNWEENGRSYLVATLKDTKHKYCFVYRGTEQMTHVSGVHDTCRRTVEPGLTGTFTFNVSSAGECDEALRSSAMGAYSIWTALNRMEYLAVVVAMVLR